ncbi:MAG TPA: S9 family peptidase [Stenotrophomonas sp.]|nr:S9 family peptidase [Stenotrophomonas sp.]
MKASLRAAALVALCVLSVPAHAQVDLDAYLRDDQFKDLKISPDGQYFAATVPLEDRTALAILRRSDNKITGSFAMGRNTHVGNFFWANDNRVLLDVAQKFGSIDQPYSTGELFAINADSGRSEILVGFRVDDGGVGTHIKPKKGYEKVYAELADVLPSDERNVIVSITPFSEDITFSTADRMDINSGRRVTVARSPIQQAGFATDNQGEVRFAYGAASDNANKLYYRDGQGSDWRLINDERDTHHVEWPIGFSEDNKVAYLKVENTRGPDAIVAWNIASNERNVVLRDAVADPGSILYRLGTQIPVGAMILTDRPHTRFFDEQGADARQYHSLEAAFGGAAVMITSGTRDGRQLLLEVWSDSDPGEFYLFDTQARRAEHVITRRNWVDPAKVAQVTGVSFKARDGLELHGFLTRPRGSEGKALPMVVLPHGGPFGVHDSWSYDPETQMLAAAGYAVLQVNYRGSSNYGRAFEQAGAQQWGLAMQDDITDATRWAIAQGHADANRICIYGASYGGYAALMGVAKEPALYKCAAGYVGIYDLPMRYSRGMAQETKAGETWLREWMGDPATLAATSPTNLADRIKVPVFLAAGGEDERAPIEHTKKMAAALQKAGVPVETLYYGTEAHGFYTLEHRREYYTKLLAFLSRSLGGQPAGAAAAQH